jgi:hypothetical protein
MKLLITSFFKPPGVPSRLGSNVLLNTLLSNTFKVPCSLSVRDQALHYTKQQGKLLFYTFSSLHLWIYFGKIWKEWSSFLCGLNFWFVRGVPKYFNLARFFKNLTKKKMISVRVVLWLYCDKLGNRSNRLVTAELLAACFTLVSYLVYSSILKLEGHVPRKRRLTFTRLHVVISQKMQLFITTAVKT